MQPTDIKYNVQYRYIPKTATCRMKAGGEEVVTSGATPPGWCGWLGAWPGLTPAMADMSLEPRHGNHLQSNSRNQSGNKTIWTRVIFIFMSRETHNCEF